MKNTNKTLWGGTAMAATLLVILPLGGCASTPSETETAAAADYNAEAYNECVRRVRRTGSRLARSQCERSMFGTGYHSSNEQISGEASIDSNR